LNDAAQRTETVPFTSADSAWLWTMRQVMIRRSGGRPSRADLQRPCEPDDVVKCLDTLYRQRRIDLLHARILRVWGERGQAPDRRMATEKADARIWNEAMDRLQWPLVAKGIVRLSSPQGTKD
jgi:hypothetical protein